MPRPARAPAPNRARRALASNWLLAGLVLSCGRRSQPVARADAGASAASSTSSSGVTIAAPEPISLRGQAIALSPDESTLIVADEDHEVLFLLPASLSDAPKVRVVALPGPPAQVVAIGARVYVTIRTLPTDPARRARDVIHGPSPSAAKVVLAPPAAIGSRAASFPFAKPAPTPSPLLRRRNTPAAPFDPSVVRASQGGLLLALRPDAAGGLVEVGRTVVAPDAWGLAITSDQQRAIVTSAWSAEVSLVDLSAMKVLATAKTAREPRGVALLPDGKTAYVSHLVGTALTRLELGTDSLLTSRQPLPAAPARALAGAELDASLGYDLVLSPDAQSLYLPRHALGAEGVGTWWGAPTVDELDLASGKPIAPLHAARSPSARIVSDNIRPSFSWEPHPGQAPAPESELLQPRAVVYRRSRDTLLIASEGWDALTEVDALAADPAMASVRVFPLGQSYDPFGTFPEHGGAPTGIALGRDERFAYVYCRSTYDVIEVELDTGRERLVHLADDALPADAAYGRRLFANAKSGSMSGGLACSGCHPEGRDDGFVWREGNLGEDDQSPRFIARRSNIKAGEQGSQDKPRQPAALYPRQTPMLAGRTRTSGPFGWHGENRDIVDRLLAGFHLHRAGWEATGSDRGKGEDIAKIDYLADFLRSGLMPPPTLARALSDAEARGKALFESNQVGCAHCHVPVTEFTDRQVIPLRPLPVRAGFDREDKTSFKTPSLWFLGGTPPYLHDGSASTLEDLLRTNADRMGNTTQLSAEDRDALAAYLRVL